MREHSKRYYPPKPVFAVWVGDNGEASDKLEAAGIPHYASESDAVGGFMHLVRYREALDELMKTPPSLPQDFNPDVAAARRIVENVVAEGRAWLDPVEVGQIA